MDQTHAPSVSPRGDGYLSALGYLQIGTGSLTLVMSLMALSYWLLGSGELLNLSNAFDLDTHLIDQAIAAYVSLQLTLGWLAGGLQLASGICCLQGRRPRLVWFASVISLANFPHGTMAAILMLHSLSQGEVASEFEEATKELDRGSHD